MNSEPTNPTKYEVIKGFVDGVAERLTGSPPSLHTFFSRPLARDQGAPSPPSQLDNPVWCESIGWAEEALVSPPHFVWVVPQNVQPKCE